MQLTLLPSNVALWTPPRSTVDLGDGLNALLRDQFITDIDPMTDPRTMEPGAGSTGYTWDVAGILAEIDDGSLGITGGGTWGDNRLLSDQSFARAEGLTFWTVYIPEDIGAHSFLGWASGAIADPRTDGASWGHENNCYTVATHGTKISLQADTSDRDMRPLMFLVGVALRAEGFYVFISTFANKSGLLFQANDRLRIPSGTLARVMWVDSDDTVSPLYPFISALNTLGYPHGTRVFDARVKQIADWSADGFLSSGIDRFTRANSTTSLGAGWTADFGTWGIDSNQGYLVSQPGGNFPHARKDFGGDGDGIWRAKIVWPTTASNGCGFIIRAVDANNFIRVWNNGATHLEIQSWVAGGFDAGIASTGGGLVLVGGNTYEITVETDGAWYRLWVNGTLWIDWTQDTNARHLTATQMGPYTSGDATGARWDMMEVVPHEFTLPADILTGYTVVIPTVGASVATEAFTAANGTAIAGTTTDTGSLTWEAVTIVGTPSGQWEVQSNAAKHSHFNDDTDPGQYGLVVDTGSNDGQVVSTITTPSSGTIIREGHMLRMTDANNYLAVRLFMDPGSVANDEIEILEGIATGGSAPPIVHKVNIGDFFALSTAYTLKTQILGNILHVYLNDEPMISYQARLATGTKFGLYHESSDDGSFQDDFEVKALS